MNTITKGRNKRLPAAWFLVAITILACTPYQAIAAADDIPVTIVEGQIAYVSGGIGQDEATEMKLLANQFPLELLFIEKTAGANAYLASTQVDIRDSSGHTMLSTMSRGPFLLVQMPPGRYTVSAQNEGRTVTQGVVIAMGQHSRLIFAW